MNVLNAAPTTGPRPQTPRRPRQPLWLQVHNAVLAMIRDGNLPQDAKLPSESEMCTQFGVSRIVVREAMSQLVAARVVYRLQGRGAFVARREETQDFVGATRSFSGELLDQHHRVTRRILRQHIGTPTARARALLRLGEQDRVVCLDRVLLIDGVPRIMVQTMLPEALVPGLDAIPMADRSLRATLQRQYGIGFVRAQRWLHATMATPEIAALLDIGAGAPVLEIESCARIEGDRPVEYYVAYYRTDQARLTLTVG